MYTGLVQVTHMYYGTRTSLLDMGLSLFYWGYCTSRDPMLKTNHRWVLKRHSHPPLIAFIRSVEARHSKNGIIDRESLKRFRINTIIEDKEPKVGSW